MIKVNLDKGKYKIPVDKGLKILKKKMLKENILGEYRERTFYVSKGRKDYLRRSHVEHVRKMQNED